MNIIYKIIRSIASKGITSLIQNQKIKLNILKGELHAGETNSLLSQMYSAENENLFI